MHIEDKGLFASRVRKFVEMVKGIYRLTALPVAEPYGFDFCSEIYQLKRPHRRGF